MFFKATESLLCLQKEFQEFSCDLLMQKSCLQNTLFRRDKIVVTQTPTRLVVYSMNSVMK